MRAWRRRHVFTEEEKKRASARAFARVYEKRGKIKREPCEICGNPNVERHHEDYSKPLEVRWLCPGHHNDVTTGKITLPKRT